MNAGIVGTGAISHKHAQAYRNIGFKVAACFDINPANGKAFAEKYGGVAVSSVEELCKLPEVEFLDVCTFPDYRMQPLELAAKYRKHVQVQKPMAINTEVCRKMIEVAKSAGIVLGVVSQHRFDDSCLFLRRAIDAGRLGRLIQCDAYVKWYRSAEYYSRPIKGSWATEGGGALINQAIHQIDVLRWLAGPVKDIKAMWQLGALHKIESEDVVNALLRYENGATGVIQASTALWPGYSERVELHGTKGSAIMTGDQLTAWDVQGDEEFAKTDPPPISSGVASGASDPMAISLTPFERQFQDFAKACKNGTKPLVSGEEGLQALEIVERIYNYCRA
ncbi:MAG TPA: Gfo/Idh/MocA family oxidoreductase [Bryobacteraceae bacterium]|nr:Gfo/Idh/MocA family oxidoreductase [Bryobacteraceae bacterium]